MTKLLLTLLLVPTAALACDELGEMRRALQQAQTEAAAAKRRAAEKALDRADAARQAMDQYLSLLYFPGLFEMRADEIKLVVPAGAAFQELSAELEFLRDAPGATSALKPGKERSAQFERLKGSFAGALKAAAGELAGLDDQKLSSRAQFLAEWGVETQVEDGGKEPVQVLTRAQRAWVFAAPEPFRDPHE